MVDSIHPSPSILAMGSCLSRHSDDRQPDSQRRDIPSETSSSPNLESHQSQGLRHTKPVAVHFSGSPSAASTTDTDKAAAVPLEASSEHFSTTAPPTHSTAIPKEAKTLYCTTCHYKLLPSYFEACVSTHHSRYHSVKQPSPRDRAQWYDSQPNNLAGTLYKGWRKINYSICPACRATIDDMSINSNYERRPGDIRHKVKSLVEGGKIEKMNDEERKVLEGKGGVGDGGRWRSREGK